MAKSHPLAIAGKQGLPSGLPWQCKMKGTIADSGGHLCADATNAANTFGIKVTDMGGVPARLCNIQQANTAPGDIAAINGIVAGLAFAHTAGAVQGMYIAPAVYTPDGIAFFLCLPIGKTNTGIATAYILKQQHIGIKGFAIGAYEVINIKITHLHIVYLYAGAAAAVEAAIVINNNTGIAGATAAVGIGKFFHGQAVVVGVGQYGCLKLPGDDEVVYFGALVKLQAQGIAGGAGVQQRGAGAAIPTIGIAIQVQGGGGILALVLVLYLQRPAVGIGAGRYIQVAQPLLVLYNGVDAFLQGAAVIGYLAGAQPASAEIRAIGGGGLQGEAGIKYPLGGRRINNATPDGAAAADMATAAKMQDGPGG
ncbi:MAG: hypothetical protein RL172_1028 [Bacteroidota bacterium]